MAEGPKTIDSSDLLIQTSEEYSQRQRSIAATKGLLKKTPANLDSSLSVIITTATPTELDALFGSTKRKSPSIYPPPHSDEKGFFGDTLLPTVSPKKIEEMLLAANHDPEKSPQVYNMLEELKNQQKTLHTIRELMQEILQG